MATTSVRTPPAARRRRRRPPLTRERILSEALALVDEDGLDALTMRGLGRRLGVEAMSLYNHVPGKDGLHDGIRELLWEELQHRLEGGETWKDSLRSIASCLRGCARQHPRAFPLFWSGDTLSESMLRTLEAGIAMLHAAGLDRESSARTLNAVLGYAAGYAMMEHSCMAAVRPVDERSDLETGVELARVLPPGAPTDLAQIALNCCAFDPDAQFEFGLNALMAGLDPHCETHDER